MADEKKPQRENLHPKFIGDTHLRLMTALNKKEGVCFGSTLTLGMAYLTNREYFDTALERLAIAVGGTIHHGAAGLQGRITRVQESMAKQAAPARIRVF